MWAGRVWDVRFRKRFAHSHQGLVRTNNEDAGFAGSTLLTVADGVGGAAAGEVASASAAYVLACYAMRPDLVDDPAVTLAEAVDSARAHLQRGVVADSSRAGMATTLTAILVSGEQCAMVHLGDSRGYLLRGGSLQRITRDDTLVQDFIDAGDITGRGGNTPVSLCRRQLAQRRRRMLSSDRPVRCAGR